MSEAAVGGLFVDSRKWPDSLHWHYTVYPIGEDEHAVAVIDGVRGGALQFDERRLHGAVAVLVRSGARLEQSGQGRGAELGFVQFLDLRQLAVGDHGPRQLELPGLGGRGIEDVAAGAQQRLGGRDEGLPLGVQGWVGDLGEELPEVVEEGLALIGEDGQGGVIAHGAGGLLGRFGHGRDEHDELFRGEALRLLAVAQRVEVGTGREFGLGQVFQADALL